MFETKGKIVVSSENLSEDDIFMAATEAGAEDVVTEEEVHVIYTEPASLMAVRKELENQEIEVQESVIDQIPKNEIKIDSVDVAKKLLKLIDMLEDNDDVSEVFANFDIPEDIIEQLEE